MVDAGGLNPPGAKALYGFDSHPGHRSCTVRYGWASHNQSTPNSEVLTDGAIVALTP